MPRDWASATSSTAVMPQSTVTSSVVPALREQLDVGGREAVAVVDPVGDQPVAVGPHLPQGADHDRRRADTVDVEVAVNGDPLAGLDRAADALDHLSPST